MSGHRSDMMKLLKKAKKQGCEVERLRNGHWRVTTPNGTIFTAPFSPHNPGGYRDTIRALRQAGVEL